jgi:hydroxymethylbilane synthase
MLDILIGTRRSKMALAQTKLVIDKLRTQGFGASAATFQTRGDNDQVSKLGKHGGKGGAFVDDLRDRLRSDEIQAIMHSLKDVPGNEESTDLVIGAYLPRQVPNDVLVLRRSLSLVEFERNGGAGRKIGTSSVRRKAFLEVLYPNAEVIHFRGSADGRLHKLDNGIKQVMETGLEARPADALVLAYSGLARIGMVKRINKVFSIDEMLPATSQGIIVTECLRSAWVIRQALSTIDDETTRIIATAEREVLWSLDGHCESPIAVHASCSDKREFEIRGAVFGAGSRVASAFYRGVMTEPRKAGRMLAEILVAKGARTLIAETK